LQQLYVKYGFFREGLVNVVRKGKDGAAEIQQMMVDYRANPPKSLLGSPIVKILDYKTLEEIDVRTGERKAIEGIDEKSNVLQWLTEDGTKVSVRPSGTEPKIKFYFGVKAPLCCVEQFAKVEKELDEKIEALKVELKLA
jgi:phosphoglucomutase